MRDIGIGGMGVVYLAIKEGPGLEQPVVAVALGALGTVSADVGDWQMRSGRTGRRGTMEAGRGCAAEGTGRRARPPGAGAGADRA